MDFRKLLLDYISKTILSLFKTPSLKTLCKYEKVQHS